MSEGLFCVPKKKKMNGDGKKKRFWGLSGQNSNGIKWDWSINPVTNNVFVCVICILFACFDVVYLGLHLLFFFFLIFSNLVIAKVVLMWFIWAFAYCWILFFQCFAISSLPNSCDLNSLSLSSFISNWDSTGIECSLYLKLFESSWNTIIRGKKTISLSATYIATYFSLASKE